MQHSQKFLTKENSNQNGRSIVARCIDKLELVVSNLGQRFEDEKLFIFRELSVRLKHQLEDRLKAEKFFDIKKDDDQDIAAGGDRRQRELMWSG